MSLPGAGGPADVAPSPAAPHAATEAAAQSRPGEAPRRVHFPCFDGYRAVAALGVVLVHVAFITGLDGREEGSWGPYLARADVGVAVFFVISGFLLYRPFVAARLAGTTWMTPGQFLKRRALRILPAYWFVLTIVAFVLHAPGFGHGQGALQHYLLIHVYDVGQVTGGPVQQSWSLATEVTFYLFVPLYVWVMGALTTRSRRPVRAEAIGVASLIGFSVALKLIVFWAGLDGPHYNQLGTWLPFRLDQFGLGMAMAVASAAITQRSTRARFGLERRFAPVVCWALAAVVYWVASRHSGLPLAPLLTSRQSLVAQLLYSVFAALLILPGVFGPQDRGLIRRFLQNPVMVWLGLISYGIYIWHEAWLTKWFSMKGHHYFLAPFWTVLGIDLLLTIAASAVTYYAVERPFLRLKNRRLLPWQLAR